MIDSSLLTCVEKVAYVLGVLSDCIDKTGKIHKTEDVKTDRCRKSE